jgi:inactivated superfamily I helicase
MVRLEESKAQKMQDNKWKQEEEARLQLMREVYESWATHIEHLKRMKVAKHIEVQREMAEL